MSDVLEIPIYPGFEGVAAFKTAICKPSSTGDSLRFRGFDVRDLAQKADFDGVWRLLVDGTTLERELPHASATQVQALLGAGEPRVALQRLMLDIGEAEKMQCSTETTVLQVRDDLSTLTSAFALGLGTLLRRGEGKTDVSPEIPDLAPTFSSQLVGAWLGDTPGVQLKVIERLLSIVAEHGTTASTFTARVVASTGASASACVAAALSAIGGPKHGGATLRVTKVLKRAAEGADSIATFVRNELDAGRRLPGMGHRIYRTEDPRVRILRELAFELDAPLLGVAEEYMKVADEQLRERRSGRPLPANIDIWIPVVLNGLGVADDNMDAFLASSRIAGWSAHIVEQLEGTNTLLRPSDVYIGP